MTKIIVLHDDQEVDEFDFDADVSRISIGRRPSNDVCVTDRSVSGGHAQLVVNGASMVIEDLSSTNGTYVNGRAISSQTLEDGDEILIGKLRLRVLASAIESAGVSPPAREETPLMRAAAKDLLPVDDKDFMDEPDLRPTASGRAALIDDDDDELDESMRAALALYSDDPVDESSSSPAFIDEDDDIDFSEDARLFAQSAAPVEPLSETDASLLDVEDDRLPDAIDESPRAADAPLTLSDRAKAALGRDDARPRLHAVPSNGVDRSPSPPAAEQREASATRVASAEHRAPSHRSEAPAAAATSTAHSLDDLRDDPVTPTHDLDRPRQRSRGAVIEIKNGAKSGQILPIDKPVTTLGRPGIQIAAIMRKPDGYFLMHIESDDSVERPTLNADSIGDEPVMLHSGDALNVAGIDVEFMLS